MDLYTEGDPIADTKAPDGPIETRWERRRFAAKLVNPANRRKLTRHRRRHRAGRRLRRRDPRPSSATRCASYCYQDSPRRAHSIAAQGGINAAKNYRNDGDSVYRLFYDTVKGGDFRSRESNVYRLAEVSVEHHRPVRGPGRAVRPRVRRPARHPLLRRRPGVAHLLRPRPDRPAAAARRVPGAGAADRGRHRGDARPARDARPDRRRRQGPRHRRAGPGHRRDHHRRSPTRSCSPPAATATSSSSPPTPRAATSPPPGARTARARASPTPATRRSTRPASRSPATTSRSSR